MSNETALRPGNFGAFYRELYPDRDPYRWHERAAMELADGTACQGGTIWQTLCAPTGAGKTTMIECFLFALACTRGASLLPRRLFWVVDRRNVVDQVYLHACEVLDRLERAPIGGLAAEALKRLEGLAAKTTGGEAVQLRLWRGGLAGEASLDLAAEGSEHTDEPRQQESPNLSAQLRAQRLRAPLSPCAAAIVCSTVDQVGSRMLFRGYGISRRSRPVEAALVATDSLIVLDEAHLSQPFHTTAAAVAAHRRPHDADAPLRSMQVLAVTATPPRTDEEKDDGRHIFELSAEERHDPALERQMAARRPAALEKGRDPATTCAKAAQQCAEDGAQVVGVVANTVAAARKIATTLKARSDTILIIGPSRPLDRAQLLDRIPPRDDRARFAHPLFVVGTQTLEVGLDIDFDALVTECAPLHSLVQRFGRLDRRGRLTASGTPGQGVIVQPPSKGCPVYGEAADESWKRLGELHSEGKLDFSVESVEEMLREAPASACHSAPPVPVMLQPWHLEMLVQTSHPLAPEPDVAVFIRGEDASLADVSVCWRGDLTDASEGTWERRVELRPPHPGELVSLPVWSVRRWLTGKLDAAGFADFEGAPEQEEIAGHEQTQVVRVRPPDYDNNIRPETIVAAQIRPGDVIVVPASFGGCDEFGWSPTSRRAVTDLGNLSRSRPRLLLSAALGLSEDLLDRVQEVRRLQASEERSQEEAYEELRKLAAVWLRDGGGYGDTPAGAAARLLARRIERASAGRAIAIGDVDPSGSADVLLAPESPRPKDAQAAVSYREHAEKVEKRVSCFARSLGLDKLAPTLAIAARYHDAGKLDRRFQAWLNGGVPADPAKPLAKSARGPGGPESWLAQRDAGWPVGKRHEAISAALLHRVAEWPPGTDRDLLLHLVSTHHGDGRPLRQSAMPANADPEQDAEAQVQVSALIDGVEITVGSDAEIPWADHARRFLDLNERFGPWGLAALESLLVLADRSVSAEGS